MSLFDGLAAALSDTFGAAVTITPPAGAPSTVQGVFRVMPTEVEAGGRPVIVDLPTLRVPRNAAGGIVVGAEVEPSERAGETYRVLTVHRSTSPAEDGFLVCELELVP
jgi:hypothetical protein